MHCLQMIQQSTEFQPLTILVQVLHQIQQKLPPLHQKQSINLQEQFETLVTLTQTCSKDAPLDVEFMKELLDL